MIGGLSGAEFASRRTDGFAVVICASGVQGSRTRQISKLPRRSITRVTTLTPSHSASIAASLFSAPFIYTASSKQSNPTPYLSRATSASVTRNNLTTPLLHSRPSVYQIWHFHKLTFGARFSLSHRKALSKELKNTSPLSGRFSISHALPFHQNSSFHPRHTFSMLLCFRT